MAIPVQAEINDKLRGEDLNTWLDLWRAEQGPAKPGALKLIAAAIPVPVDRSLRVLDVGCGTGDAGRAIHSRFPTARIDFVDRNEFFVALCDAVNRRGGITGQTLVRDLSEPNWQRDLATEYDVVVAVNTMHWFTLAKAAELLGDIFQSLRSGGVFLLMEPAGAAPRFALGFDTWKKQQPAQHKYEDWQHVWSRVNALVGYDYGFLGDPPDNQDRIGAGGNDFANDVLHDLVVGVEQVIATHAGLARDAGGDDDDVGIGGGVVIIGAQHMRIALLDGHRLKQVECFALRNAFRDVHEHDVGELLARDPMCRCCANVSSADDRDFLTHVPVLLPSCSK